MPGFTYLADYEIRAWQHVDGDDDCEELLQDLRKLSGEEWLVRVREFPRRRTLADRLLRRPRRTIKVYTLFLGCHGEWQVMNLVTPRGGTTFHFWEHTRESVMNFMLGYVSALEFAARQRAPG